MDGRREAITRTVKGKKRTMKPGFLGTEKKIVVVVGVGVVSQEERRRKLETDGRRGYMPKPARPSHQGEARPAKGDPEG